MTIEPINEQLCTACGLCCDGTLYTHVQIKPEDGAVPRESATLRADGEAFSHPCPHFCGICAIYDRRPTTCRTYACKLLGDHLSGKVDARQARLRVDTLRALGNDLRERLDLQDGSLCAAVTRFTRDANKAENLADFRRANAETLLAVGAYIVTVREHFEKKADPEAPVAMSTTEGDEPAG